MDKVVHVCNQWTPEGMVEGARTVVKMSAEEARAIAEEHAETERQRVSAESATAARAAARASMRDKLAKIGLTAEEIAVLCER